MPSTAEELRRALLGKNSLIYLNTWEEERALRLLEGFANKLYRGQGGVTTWSFIDGFEGSLNDTEATDPAIAIQRAISHPERGFFIFIDLSEHLDRADVVRALRTAYQEMPAKDQFLFIVDTQVIIPKSLNKEIYLIEMLLPDEQELYQLIQRTAQSYGQELEPSLASELPVALKGFTLHEAQHALHRIFRSPGQTIDDKLEEVFLEKGNVVRKSGLLDFIRPKMGIDMIGGLDNLKDWLVRRKKLFSREAIEDGVPTPKGILIMGVSGCGKSFAAKAVSALWRVPLYRLDMSLVFSGEFGAPEAAFNRALRTVEALAPSILWIDEIENSLGMEDTETGGVGINSQIFSAFLTWMQEKPELVFVAATANRIEALPAEVIRKGRFDQVYFVDLPSDEEREHIFRIHLADNKADPEEFDFSILRAATKGWTGAEIEEAVRAASIDAYSEGIGMNMDHLTANTAIMVPLSTTMSEQIKRIRAWAVRRATPASKYGTVRV